MLEIAHPLAACEERSIIELRFVDGRLLTGFYTARAGHHFLLRTGPGLPLIGQIDGPFEPGDIATVHILKSRAEVLAEARKRLHGERVPGRDPVTRDDFQYRLEALARAAAQCGDDWQREMQVRRQFDELADRISLAAGKRAWLHNAARWSLRSNAVPMMTDIWVEDVASPSCLARPQAEDFDPDSTIRNKRRSVPAHVRADPHSIPNMLAALHTAGFKARITRLGDPPWNKGHIQVDLPLKGRSRFIAIGQRSPDQTMAWHLVWDGNESKAGLLRYRRAVGVGYLDRLKAILRDGRRGVQTDLFAP